MILHRQTRKESMPDHGVASVRGAGGNGKKGQTVSPCYDHQDDANHHIDSNGSSGRLAGLEQAA